MSDVDAVVLAGGRARRLGGVDKALLEIVEDGAVTTLVARACRHVAAARRIVVVGGVDPAEVPEQVTVVREDPPFGGPAAALGAGLAALGPDAAATVLVLACDLPDAGPAVAALLAAVASGARADAVVAVDETGRRQWLTAAYRTSSLAAALAASAPLDGVALRHVVAGLTRTEVLVPGPALHDVDTWDAVALRGSIRRRPDDEGADHG